MKFKLIFPSIVLSYKKIISRWPMERAALFIIADIWNISDDTQSTTQYDIYLNVKFNLYCNYISSIRIYNYCNINMHFFA